MTEVSRVAVLGSGTMGSGIAQVCAAAGCTTFLFDVDGDALERGFDRIRANLDKGVELGKLSRQEHHDTLNQLMGAHDLGQAVSGVDLVVEALDKLKDPHLLEVVVEMEH